MRQRIVYVSIGATVFMALGAALLLVGQERLRPFADKSEPTVSLPLSPADAHFASRPRQARGEYESFVARNARSRDPEVRDRVGAARMRLGYLAARTHDLPAARAAFLQAAGTAGTGAMGAFGSVSDQAAYQAVVCLVAEGRKDEAVEGFVALLRDRPLSPLSRAAYGRLRRLSHGESRPEWDALMQAAVARQEARARFETSVCGPKCLERILSGDGRPSPAIVGDRKLSYTALAKLCGTTDSGTTVEGMRKGLRSLGMESWAARLDRQDLAKARLPAVLFEGDHYVVLERVEGDRASVWDPRFAASHPWKLPPQDDPDFSATLILLAKPEGL